MLGLADCAWAVQSPSRDSNLPDLPSVVPDSFPPSIREKVREAYAGARTHPQDSTAVGRLGMILHAYQSNDQRAEVCYQRARLLDPRSFRWAYYLGSVQAARGRHAAAVQTFREALGLEPDSLPAQLKLGDSLLASGDAEGARDWFESVVRDHPESAQAYYGLGRAQSATKDLEGSVGSLRKACELFPDFGAAHYALALAYRRYGKTAEAQEETALYEAHRYDIAGAGDRLQADLNEFFTSPAQLIGLGIEFARQGKLEQAAANHEEALAIDPQQIRAHINLISIYGRLSQFAKGEEHYRAAVRMDPNSVESHYNFSVLLINQGRFVEAEEPLRKVLQIDPQHAEAHNNLGDVLQRQGKLEEAVAEFRSAIAARPDFPQAHFNLGRILVNQRNFREGIEELGKALSTKDPAREPTYLYALGSAYARAGDREKARQYILLARDKAQAQQQTLLHDKIDQALRQLEGKTGGPN